MVTKEIRYPAAPTAAPTQVSQAKFESLARAKAEEWPSAIAATMLALYPVDGCDGALFKGGKAAALKLRLGPLTKDNKLAIGRAIVDHHLAIQEKKGLVVYLRKDDNA